MFTLEYHVEKSSPTLARFHRSDREFRAICGPIGGGKSVACCIEIFRRCQQQKKGVDGYRRSRWVVVRNTYGELRDTTLKTWLKWFPDGSGVGYWRSGEHTYFLEFDDVRAEILFRALDTPADVAKVLSMELTGAWINECREIPQEIIEGIQGRLERYPAQDMGGSNYWMMIADTNPPAIGTYWWKIFEHVPLEDNDPDTIVDCDTFHQPSGVSPEAENLPNLAPGYYTKKVKGRSRAWIDVFIHAKYAVSQDGKPVYHDTFNRDRHVSKTPLPVHPSLPVIVGQDFGLCYDDKTEVLTESGWKLFADVDEHSDRVATRDPATGKMEYTDINFKVARPYSGKLIGWKSTEVDFLVTPEHRIPYTRRDHPDEVHFAEAQWVAEHMGAHLFVDVTSNWDGENFVPVCGMMEETYAELMGWLASDGSVEVGTNRVSVCQVKPHEDLKMLLDRTPFKWCRTAAPGGKGDLYRTSNAELHDHIVQEWGRTKPERRVATCVKNARPGIIKLFLRSFLRGDGQDRVRKNGSVEKTIYAHSRELAGDLQELIQKSGWNSSLRTQRGQESTLQSGRKITSTDGHIVTIKSRAKRAELHKRNYYEQQYDGMIYCLNVPYHTLYIRRNGKPSWNGNTPAGLWMQMQEDGRIFVLRETPAFDMGIKRYISSKFRPMQKTVFPLNPIVVIGDPSGVRRSDSDEGTCFREFKKADIMAKPAPTNDPNVRIKIFDDLFSEYPDCRPRILIDPSCKNFIAACQMLYRYPRKKQSMAEEYSEKPEKNDASHLMEAGQYGALFLTGGKYDPADFVVYDDLHNPLQSYRAPYRPALSVGY